ncbi:EcoKI restriction-modification system protein HsdS [bacterium BMS3Bbin12]|nr:EcoKI restriction-modification system protein HsdS [bacterium BMS3Bbin12]
MQRPGKPLRGQQDEAAKLEELEYGEGEWFMTSLREANVTLIDCDHRTPPAAGTGYPYVAIPQLLAGRVILDGVRRISKEHYLKWTRKAKPRADDVVLSRRCNPGETAVAPSNLEYALGQNLVLLRADGTRIYPAFLRWLVRGPEWWRQISKFINAGAVFDSLKCGDIPNFELRIPPLPEQRAIAHVLGTLDDKIELNRRMSETLETMARALFKSWFVDFDPVRAKCRGEPACSPQFGQVPQSGQAHRPAPTKWPQHILDLFPDRLVDSELGEIPEGWEVEGLDRIAQFLNGLALQKYPPTDNRSLPAIKIAQLRAGNTSGADQASVDLDPNYIVEDGDILFSWSGSLECEFWAGGRGALNQHLFKVTSATYPHWLCYLGIHAHLDDFRHIAAGKATTMGHIQRHHLSNAKLAVPPKPLLRIMDNQLNPIIDSLWRRKLESHTLAALRDTLLPKLISGELRVKDAEKFIERTI